MKHRPVPAGQLSLDDYLARHKWCNRHHRLDCACGHKAKPGYRESIETKIIEVMRLHAAGRVPRSSEWISIQLLAWHGIDRHRQTVLNHLQAMERRGLVTKKGRRGEYQLVQNLDSLQVRSNSILS